MTPLRPVVCRPLAGLLVVVGIAFLSPPASAQTEAPAAPPPPPLVETPPASVPATPPPTESPAPAPPVPPQPEATAAFAAAPVPTNEPIAGVSDSVMFLRSPDGMFTFFPNGRLQNDIYLFKTSNASPSPTPNRTFLIKRARLELSGWIGTWVYFHLAGDFASSVPATSGVPVVQSNLATTDNFVALAPYGTIAMLQVGQFDAPFTLENRTSDKYFDFMERSITVRAFGIPDNKEIGGMDHGYNENRNFLYSAGVFNGDGQNYKNVDKEFDVMARAWLAPLSFMGDGPLHDATIGGSFWTGDRANALAPTSQTTQAGFTFLSFSTYNTTVNGMANTPVQLRQVGRMYEYALELNVPVAHRFGVRSEYVWRHSPLSEEQIASNGTGTILGGVDLQGWSTYEELWFWAVGDDRIIGDQQGIQPYSRFKKFGIKPPQNGLMFALRFEVLRETISQDADTATLMLGDPSIGKTNVESFELGVNYWYSKRFRATFNYVYNHFDRGDGATSWLQKKLVSPNEQEFLFRLAIAL